ncbi:General secretion pathway, M protein [Bacillus sp. THAF10]|uniref:pilus assembly protein PilO n=1 Tax=Bacillus sp. THAF10 TaxID=2587848 RepID=UPI0012685254|nr:pilus assembly protein PilO [Bacillus sp. THAF10]QFT90056.1 General secretion pathway, M protein [Bacillus sp. THAF10]
MMIEMERKHYLLFGISVLGIVLGIAAFYYLGYLPQERKAEQLQNDLKIEQQLIQVLDQQQATSAALNGNTVELQRKIPVTPFVEQLVLELDKAELLSESTIVNMTFGDSAFTPASTTLDEYVESQTPETTETEVATEFMPEGLNKVTVNLAVESETYEALKTFLSSLENLTRITQIESVTFTGQPEVTSTEQVMDTLSYSVTLSAFYYPELHDLVEDLPPLSVPEPANKTNPFLDTN